MSQSTSEATEVITTQPLMSDPNKLSDKNERDNELEKKMNKSVPNQAQRSMGHEPGWFCMDCGDCDGCSECCIDCCSAPAGVEDVNSDGNCFGDCLECCSGSIECCNGCDGCDN